MDGMDGAVVGHADLVQHRLEFGMGGDDDLGLGQLSAPNFARRIFDQDSFIDRVLENSPQDRQVRIERGGAHFSAAFDSPVMAVRQRDRPYGE